MENVITHRRIVVSAALIAVVLVFALPAVAQKNSNGGFVNVSGEQEYDIPAEQEVGQPNMLARGEMYMWNRMADFGDVITFRKGAVKDFGAGFINRDPSADDNNLDPMAMRRPCRQLGRGTTNVLLGWWEVPRNMIDINKEDGHMAGATFGLFRGLVRATIRTGVGLFEIVTFPMGWNPVVRPEFVLQGNTLEKQRWKVQSPYFEKLSY